MPPATDDIVKARLMDEADLDRTLNRLARQVVEELEEGSEEVASLALVGMQTRGVPLARRIRDKIEGFEGLRLPFGILDSTMYRDDFRRRFRQPVVHPTDIPFDVDERSIILVDDVVYTGRTTRAALDALMDLGRPASVRFLALIDRGLRELPIRPDFVGRTVPTSPGEEVRVRVREIDGEDGVWLVETEPPARDHE
jgi:pyrimidine operon attenuation protein / uracil phosphoribosyltransferase